MSRLNEIKKIRYKLDNANSLELSREKIEFLCDWAEKGIVAISKTETTSAKKIVVDIQLRPMLDELEVDIDDIKEYINKLD